ncbi:MAG TPA: hypothetical protein PKK55_02945 [Methanofastidiosum sp.]|nr:hypothetical protein [Methanofastidiosum sp.]HNZ87461.1 hypothetical protein [Methanofastidiosum sp.]HOC78092.1 hypothetical protein [Methanofastidiosum sp.]HOG73710.1 hypothetical protein [Methanofastidiosum sp.]HPA49262.1 hypothetical protein [Methanofastidiosum sp.]
MNEECKEQEKKIDSVMSVMNAWVYGIEKTANSFFGKPEAFYRQWIIISIRPFIAKWKELGAEFKYDLEGFDAAKMYVEEVSKTGFMDIKDHKIEGDSENFVYTVFKCPYNEHCNMLVKEDKVEKLACLRAMSVLGAMEMSKSGESKKWEYKPQFKEGGPCIIEFKKTKK